MISSSTHYKLAAIDIDGTLLGPDSRISRENIAAVHRLRDSGVYVVLASGRRHENMLGFHRQLGLDSPLISCQGALVKDERTGRIIHERRIPPPLAIEAVNEGLSQGMTIVFYRDSGIYVSKHNWLTDLYHSRGGDQLVEYGTLEALHGDSPHKMIWLNTPEIIAAKFATVSDHYHGRLEAVVTYPEYLELIAHGVSKATGIGALASDMGIDSQAIVVFGDGDNDIPMFEWAGHSIAMSESTPGAKAAARAVAPPGEPGTSLARAIDEILAS